MTGDPRDPPGAARERTMAVAELAELELVIYERAPSAWCRARLNGDACPICPCWRCAALRIIKYSGVTT